MTPWARWETLRQQSSRRWIGLMSGTSLDGLDIALVQIHGDGQRIELRLEEFACQTYSPPWRMWLHRVTNPHLATPTELAQFHVSFGQHCADLVAQQVQDWGIPLSEVDAVASHGQTVLHLPLESPLRSQLPTGIPSLGPATLQLGDADQLASRLRVPVVSDFRMKDLAGEGSGAPLLPYIDYLLFSQKNLDRVVHNLGGMSNLTFLPGNQEAAEVLAFDTGPANVLLDLAMRHAQIGQDYDQNGDLAAQGKVHEALLREWLEHPYFRQTPPKSTGREEFGSSLFEQWWLQTQQQQLSLSDVLATLTALTAESIADAYQRFLPRLPQESFLSGGGASNTYLRRQIEQRLPTVRFRDFTELGQPPAAREAIGFAILGDQFLMGIPVTFPGITGNQRNLLLGKLSLPY